MENIVMEDQNSSQYLRRLQSLAGSTVRTNLLRRLWMRGLPEKLKTNDGHPDREYASGDGRGRETLYSLLPARPAIHEVAADTSLLMQMQQLSLEFAAMKPLMAALLSQVDELSSGGRARSQQPSRPGSRSLQRSRSREPRPAGVCGYHWTFRHHANKCTSPCAWTSENKSRSRSWRTATCVQQHRAVFL
jgi:hypothetical protein